MPKLFEHSESNWCESQDLEFHSLLVEPYNVLSGLSLFIIALFLYLEFGRDKDIHYLAKIIFSIGLGTILFHGTMLQVFKLWDQISIILLLFACTAHYLQYKLEYEQKYINIVALCTLPIFSISNMNIFLLSLGVIMAVVVNRFPIYAERDKYLLRRVQVLFFISLAVWFFDKRCINGYHSHWIFHILISFVAYFGIKFLHRTRIHYENSERNYFSSERNIFCQKNYSAVKNLNDNPIP